MESKSIRASQRGVNAVWGILAIVALIVLAIVFLVYPAYVLAILILFLGLGLAGAGAAYFPAHLKVVGIVGGIVLMVLGAILAIVAASNGALRL